MPLPEGPLRMVKALKRLEAIVGNARSHRHGTLAERAAYVAVHATHPEVRRRFARHMRRLRWGFAGIALALVGVAAARLPSDLALARALDQVRNAASAYERAFEAEDRDPAAADGDWRAAHEGFRAAALALEGRTELRAAHARAQAWLAAGDAALHGLDDAAAAAEAFEEALLAVGRPGVDAIVVRHATFTALVDLARASLRLGRPVEELRALEGRANRALPSDDGEDGAYYRARLLLVASAITAVHGTAEERAKAERTLEELAKRPAKDDRWIELRRDARADLAHARKAR
jgi:hypothetical protein